MLARGSFCCTLSLAAAILILFLRLDQHLISYNIIRNEQLFDRADTNGDGILSIQEFKDIVLIAEPDVQEVDILALYDFISGVDGTIDKEEFATGMHLVHAQIVKNLRNQL